ncbi:MAG: hypothetical protein MHMPM18_002196 [Marteilia pararefringens]
MAMKLENATAKAAPVGQDSNRSESPAQQMACSIIRLESRSAKIVFHSILIILNSLNFLCILWTDNYGIEVAICVGVSFLLLLDIILILGYGFFEIEEKYNGCLILAIAMGLASMWTIIAFASLVWITLLLRGIVYFFKFRSMCDEN